MSADGKLIIANSTGCFLNIAKPFPLKLHPIHTSPATYFEFGQEAVRFLEAGLAVVAYELGALPPGISYDAAGHRLIGTPKQAGTFPVPITAHNPFQTVKGTLVVNVQQAHVPYSFSDSDRAYDGTPKPAIFHNPRPDIPSITRYRKNGSYVYTEEPPVEVGDYYVEIAVNDPNYIGSASGSYSISAGAAQTITFKPLPNRVVGDRFALSATASSGLPVRFRVIAGPATYDGPDLTRIYVLPLITHASTESVIIAAIQDGGERRGGTYAPAEPVFQVFEVSLSPPPKISP